MISAEFRTNVSVTGVGEQEAQREKKGKKEKKRRTKRKTEVQKDDEKTHEGMAGRN
jgi:hypothetical protein